MKFAMTAEEKVHSAYKNLRKNFENVKPTATKLGLLAMVDEILAEIDSMYAETLAGQREDADKRLAKIDLLVARFCARFRACSKHSDSEKSNPGEKKKVISNSDNLNLPMSAAPGVESAQK
jgi:hypothetical protein